MNNKALALQDILSNTISSYIKSNASSGDDIFNIVRIALLRTSAVNYDIHLEAATTCGRPIKSIEEYLIEDNKISLRYLQDRIALTEGIVLGGSH